MVHLKCVKLPTSNDSFHPQRHFRQSPQADLLFLPPKITELTLAFLNLENFCRDFGLRGSQKHFNSLPKCKEKEKPFPDSIFYTITSKYLAKLRGSYQCLVIEDKSYSRSLEEGRKNHQLPLKKVLMHLQ